MLKNRLSLSFKLLVPALLSCVFIVGSMDYLISKGAQELLDQHVKEKAVEYIESFLIATEVSGSRANIIRVTNSLGTYADIEELFIIDNKQQKIIASNMNRFNGKGLEKLPAHYDMKRIINSSEKYYKELQDNNYLFSSRATTFSEDRTSQRSITILILTSPDSINTFFSSFKNRVFNQSVFIFIFALLLFYLCLKFILLNPVQKIIRTLSEGRNAEEPMLCEIKSRDELGVLVSTYNNMILERHDQRQALITANKELEQLSHHDALTGISNRRHFDHALHQEWHRAIRKHEMMSLIMIDIDYFKQFNDNYGHLAGDDCLKIVAATLNNTLKRPGDLVSRYGGEEFVMILPHSNDAVWELAESCRREIENLVIFHDDNNKPVSVTISMGLAFAKPLKGQYQGELIKAADMALYEAKATGRNIVVVQDLSKDVTDDEFKQQHNVIPFKGSK